MALIDVLLGSLSGAMGGPRNAQAANPLLQILMSMLASQGGAGMRGGPAGGPGGLGEILNRMGPGGMPGGPGAGAGHPMGGLGEILDAFRRNGLGDRADSWVGTGPNQPISAEDIERTLGIDRVGEVARQAGVPPRDAANGMAVGLPELIDKLTPRGQVPQGGVGDLNAIMEALGIRR